MSFEKHLLYLVWNSEKTFYLKFYKYMLYRFSFEFQIPNREEVGVTGRWVTSRPLHPAFSFLLLLIGDDCRQIAKFLPFHY